MAALLEAEYQAYSTTDERDSCLDKEQQVRLEQGSCLAKTLRVHKSMASWDPWAINGVAPLFDQKLHATAY